MIPIEIPPLRKRQKDIPELIAHFVGQLDRRTGIMPKTFSEPAMSRLQRRNWPDNMRKLRNAVERLLILTPERAVSNTDVDRLLRPAIMPERPSPSGNATAEADANGSLE